MTYDCAILIQFDRARERTGTRWQQKCTSRRNIPLLIIHVLFLLLIIGIVKYLKLVLDCIPLMIVDREAGGKSRRMVEGGMRIAKDKDVVQGSEGQNKWLMMSKERFSVKEKIQAKR